MTDGMSVTLFEGHETLEVVGESHYQEEIQTVVHEVGREIAAVLVPEPENPYDSNAVSVWVAGVKVGHLSRSDAELYQMSVARLMRQEGKPIAVAGSIHGGEPGKPSFGVFLRHDPEDFGVRRRNAYREEAASEGSVDTGTSHVSHTSWYEGLPNDPVRSIKTLRGLLEKATDPIDRHFMFNELEKLYYKCRDVFASALDEFDEVCEQHHSEMISIRPALLEEFGDIPVLPTYRQAAIRCQKLHDYQAALTWVERGLEIYGEDANRPDGVEDLQQRSAKFQAKLGLDDSGP